MAKIWWKLGSRLCAAAAVSVSAVTTRAADEKPLADPQGAATQHEVQLDEDVLIGTPPGVVISSQAPLATVVRLPLADHWLGLNCSPVTAVLRCQLKLDGDHGLVIESLAEDGPAAKGGLKQHDILLTAGDVQLKGLADLVKLLTEGKDKEIAFRVVRGGEQQSVTVKPEKRPAPAADEGPMQSGVADQKVLEMLREQLGKNGMPMRMQFFHPGVMLPPGAAAAPIPDNLHFHIDKQGGKPAKIVVERGDDRWETTEDQLDKLPDDVRPHVENLLGQLPRLDVKLAPATATPFNIPAPPAGVDERLEKRLEELNHRLERMGQQLDELRRERGNAERGE